MVRPGRIPVALFRCSSCGFSKSVPDTLIGVKAKCTACRGIGEIHPDSEEGDWEILDQEMPFASEAGLDQMQETRPKQEPEERLLEDEVFEEILGGASLDLNVDDIQEIQDDILSRREAKPPVVKPEFIPPGISITERESAGLAPRFGLLHGKPIANILAGIMVGFSTFIACLAYANLIFTNTLPAEYFFHGMTVVFLSAIFLGLAMAVDTTLPAMAAGPEGVSAVAIWTLAGSISTAMSGRFSNVEMFETILAGIVISSLSIGIVSYALGRLKGATWMRFLPYQVVAGLIVGAALLLLKGVYELTRSSPCQIQLPGVENCPGWLPVLAIGGLLYLFLWKRTNPLPFIIAIIACVGLSMWLIPRYAAPQLAIPVQDWFLPADLAYKISDFYASFKLEHVQWSVLGDQIGYFLAIIAFVCGSALVKLTQLESSLGQGADMNREFATLGLGSILSGAAGGMPGSISLYRSLGLASLEGRGMLASLAIVSTICGGLYLAPAFTGYIPRWLPPALLVFFSFRLIKRIMWDFRGAYTRQLDYLILFSVAGLILVLGLPLGMAMTLLLALAVLVVRSGRMNPIRHALSGGQFRSKVERSASHMRLLRAQGAVIYILRLQGYLFLGSFQSIAAEVRARQVRDDLPPLRYLILDFSRVVGLDSSVGLGLSVLKEMALEKGYQIVFTNLPLEHEQLLERAGLTLNDPERNSHTYLDVDYALEWSENQVIREAGVELDTNMSLDKRIGDAFGLSGSEARLQRYMDRIEVPGGSVIIKEGEFSNSLYFVDSGVVTIRLTLQDGSVFRLR